ncbi:MAG: 1,4-dihydroxy-2-naphthoate polyprenyltransferase [Propioniciclava sp.]
MAGVKHWVEGARLRTLPAAIAPVIVGSAVAWWFGGFVLERALLALLVALALQVGVNFANDYSDGVRGTDADRVGPLRLVGSGMASPQAVKRAAGMSFLVAAVAGLVLVLLTQAWWLLGIGLACIVAAWYYTGGRRPYGYAGWGEVMVFIFFGLVATSGTTFVQLGSLPAAAWWGGVLCGSLASAILVANNLRDREGDARAGKQTLAVRLGDSRTRALYVALILLAAGSVAGLAITSTPAAATGLVLLAFLIRPIRDVCTGARGRDLVRVLKLTGVAELAGALGIALGVMLP